MKSHFPGDDRPWYAIMHKTDLTREITIFIKPIHSPHPINNKYYTNPIESIALGVNNV